MSKLYHLSNGEAKRCSAKAGNCPFGADAPHFDTVQEAQKFYENSRNNETVSSLQKSVPFSKEEINPALSNVLDIDLLNRMIKERDVMDSAHPLDESLRVLCYGPLVQVKGRWNDVTRKARGLIVQKGQDDFSDAVIVQRPWEKFFTLQQVSSGWSLGDEEEGADNSANNDLSKLDFNAPAEVTDKMDGSLGVLYTDPNGDPALSTKGSFVSEQATYYTKMLRKNENFLNASHQLLNKHPDTTFTFELISDGDYQIVLDYDKDDISMIGAIKKSNGLYLSTKDYQGIWTPENGLTTAEYMEASNLREAFAIPDREEREGVVVRIISDDPEKQMQIKIKQEDYKKLHRAFTGFSKKLAREIVRDTPATYGDLLKLAESRDVHVFEKVSETINSIKGDSEREQKIKEKRTKLYEDALLGFADNLKNAKDYIDLLPEDSFKGEDAKRDFAMSIKNERGLNKALLFKLFDAKVRGKSIEEIDAKTEMRSASQHI